MPNGFQHNVDLNRVGQRAERATSGLTQTKSPFQQAFQTVGLGGKRQQAFQQQTQQQLAETRKGVGDIAKQQYGLARQQLGEQKGALQSGIQDYQTEWLEARNRLGDWVDSQERNIFLMREQAQKALRDYATQARQMLTGYIDEESARVEEERSAGLIGTIGAGLSIVSAAKGTQQKETTDFSTEGQTLKQQLGSTTQQTYRQQYGGEYGQSQLEPYRAYQEENLFSRFWNKLKGGFGG